MVGSVVAAGVEVSVKVRMAVGIGRTSVEEFTIIVTGRKVGVSVPTQLVRKSNIAIPITR